MYFVSDTHARGCAGDLGQDSDSRSLEDEEQKPVLTAPSRRQVIMIHELSLVPKIDVQSSGGAVRNRFLPLPHGAR
jgi:hypothetical protein